MPCYNTVPISVIPPVSQGVAPILWQNGNQITRLNIPLNPSFLIYDGSKTRWGDGSAQAPVYLPNIQEVNSPLVTYVAGITSTGQLVKTLGVSGTALVGGSAGAVVYQTAPSATGFTAVGTSGQILSSNGASTPSWLNQSSISAGSATTSTNIASGVAGAVLYQTAPSNTGFTAAGTSGQVLLSNGTSAPTWSTNIAGNSGTATQLETSRTLEISGDVTGTASFNGSANANIVGTIANGVVTYTKLGTEEQKQISKAWLFVTTAVNTNGAAQIFTGYNVESIIRGATAGLYTITLTSGTFTGPVVLSPISGTNNAGVRISSFSGNTCVVQSYVGAAATDMQFNMVYFSN